MNRREFAVAGLAGAAAMAGVSEATTAKAATGRPFPKGFQWGVATAAHQTEGNNVNSDFWLLEHMKPTPFREPSGDACDSYHRYDEDIAIVAKLGLSTYRYSIEWARIEPEPGAFSQAELDHYRRMAEACRKLGVRPLATFHHFTSPRWLAAMGGWTDPATPDRFAAYADKVTRAMGDLLDGVCTINEPNGPVEGWALAGDKAPPGVDMFAALAAKAAGSSTFSTYGLGDALKNRDGMIAGHIKARAAIKAARASLPVGITLALTDLTAAPGGEALYAHVYAQARKPFYDAARGDDFVGVQSYTRTRVGPTGPLAPTERVLPMHYEYWPQALEACVREAARETGCPVLVTENGIGTEDDAERIAYTEAALAGLRRCIKDGLDVRGYIHWSLMDNFEWLEGYRPKFGLVSVDRTTFKRTLKPSALRLAQIAKSHGAVIG
jgi:beta-glucosidase